MLSVSWPPCAGRGLGGHGKLICMRVTYQASQSVGRLAQAPNWLLSCEQRDALFGTQPFTPKPFVPELTKPPRVAENLKYVPGKDVLPYEELKSAPRSLPANPHQFLDHSAGCRGEQSAGDCSAVGGQCHRLRPAEGMVLMLCRACRSPLHAQAHRGPSAAPAPQAGAAAYDEPHAPQHNGNSCPTWATLVPHPLTYDTLTLHTYLCLNRKPTKPYTLSWLVAELRVEDGVDMQRREAYLSDADFEAVCTRASPLVPPPPVKNLGPSWRQGSLVLTGHPCACKNTLFS